MSRVADEHIGQTFKKIQLKGCVNLFRKILHRIASNPRIYDQIQYFFGFKETCRRLMPYLQQMENQIVLDVGAGTGNYASILPQSVTYLWFDNDPQKLRSFKKKCSSVLATLGDATQIGLKDKSVDYVLCVALSHHLSDLELPLLFAEIARIVKRRLIFLDAVEYKKSMISNLLWKDDRGNYPRSAETVCSVIERWFELERIEHYAIYHRYLLCVGRPKWGV